MAQSETERILEQMGCDDDQGWDWFDADAATAPDRDVDPDEARKHLDDPEWLREQYVEHERPATVIGAELGISPSSVRNALEQHGIDRRGTAPLADDAATSRYSTETLQAALRAATTALGKTPRPSEYEAWREGAGDHWPTAPTLRRRLGTDRRWQTSLAAAAVQFVDAADD